MKRKAMLLLLVLLITIPFISNVIGGEKENKIYVVYLTSDNNSYVLGDLSNVPFLTVNCLKGKQIDKGWVEGKYIYIPLDKIKCVVEFNTYEEYLAAVKKFNDENKDK